jgi:hypothetical protein
MSDSSRVGACGRALDSAVAQDALMLTTSMPAPRVMRDV